MTFSFNHPLVLLLVPLAAAYVIYTSKRLSLLKKSRRTLIIALRCIVLTLLIICIAGFGIKNVSNHTTDIFLVDGSDSTIKSKSAMEDFIRSAVKGKHTSDKIGIINFGTNSVVEMNPSEKPTFSNMQTQINGNFTNIEQALKLASSMIPSGDKKRIILLSDGRENTGNSLKQARLLKQQNIILDVFPVENDISKEVQVKEIKLPETLHRNERFDVTVKLDSTVKTRAVIKLFADRELAFEKSIEVQTGENNFVFSDTAKKGGLITYTAVIEPVDDTLRENNKMSAFSTVEDVAHILVIQDKDEGASELVKILGKDVNVKVSKPENVPLTVDELQKFDASIISNVSAEKLNDKFLSSLEICIKDQGRGLLVTGGENSYAPGGYFKTPLEKILPVNMDIKPKEELPNLGLVLVIDKSGSMSEGQYGVSKVELAKEAALRSTEVLRKEDMIGVIAFDDAVQWVVKTQKLDNLKSVQNAIGSIRSGGGTQIINPLEEAYKSLKKANTKLKHIILLTDGQAEKNGYDALMENLYKEGITLSTVAVGRSADTQLLNALAVGGRGRFYATDEFTDIPKIFAKETFLAGKTYINNRTFTPKQGNYSDILKDIQAIPTLDGYVSTSPKSAAKIIFASDRDDPVLATWQYGLGRTVAWTSDAKGIWTSKWLQWEQSVRFWKNIVSWLTQKRLQGDYTLKSSFVSGTASIELTVPPDQIGENEKVEAILVNPSGVEQKFSLDPTSPGSYKGNFESNEPGVYVTNISIKKGNEVIKSISSGLNIPYSPEYDISRKDNSAFLKKLSYEGGGRVLKNSKEVFSGSLPPVVSMVDMTPILITLMIFLLMLDIAARRLNIDFGKALSSVEQAASQTYQYTVKVTKPLLRKIHKPQKLQKSTTGHTPPPAEPAKTEVSEETNTQGTTSKPVEKIELSSHISTLLEKKKKRQK